MISAENVRFHAAGHIAAACLLVGAGQPAAASTVMGSIHEYVNHPKVNAPDQLKHKVSEMIKTPDAEGLRLLEAWFVDPLNTTIENG